MGDAEYLLAFERVVMPIARSYNPELVLVSAGSSPPSPENAEGGAISDPQLSIRVFVFC